jgi:hypothetical protein
MKTINAYLFEELSEDSRKCAIESIRRQWEDEERDFSNWAIDGLYVLGNGYLIPVKNDVEANLYLTKISKRNHEKDKN